MSRPEFLRCPMTPEIIRSIKQQQETYDKNPEEYERQERQQEEEIQRQREEEAREEAEREKEGRV